MRRALFIVFYLLLALLFLIAEEAAHDKDFSAFLALFAPPILYLPAILLVRFLYETKAILTSIFLLTTVAVWVAVAAIIALRNADFNIILLAWLPTASTLVAYVATRVWRGQRLE